MAERSLDERVEILEKKVGDWQEWPARMDTLESQILQLRVEMRDGFLRSTSGSSGSTNGSTRPIGTCECSTRSREADLVAQGRLTLDATF